MILQNGEFGIGFLSIFMLGNEIEVQTRKFGTSNGLIFDIRNTDEMIDINRCNCEIGTKIIIKLKDTIKNLGLIKTWYGGSMDEIEIMEYPFMEYYYLDNPKVVYTHDGKVIERNMYYDVEDDDFFGLPDYYRNTEFSLKNWNKIDGLELYWRFSSEPAFYLNGFKMHLSKLNFDYISIALFDIEHKFKYDLARENINDFPYYNKVIDNIKEYVMCNIICRDKILKHQFKNIDSEFDTENLKLDVRMKSSSEISLYITDFLFGKNNFSVIDDTEKCDLNKKVYLVFIKDDLFYQQDYSFIKDIQKTELSFVVLQPIIESIDSMVYFKYTELLSKTEKIFVVDNKDFLNETSFRGKTINISELSDHPLLNIGEIINNKEKIIMLIEFNNYDSLLKSMHYSSPRKHPLYQYSNKNDLKYIPYDMDKRKQKYKKYFELYEMKYKNNLLRFCIMTLRTVLGDI